MYLFILNIGSVSVRKSQLEGRTKCWIGKLEFTVTSLLYYKNKKLYVFPLKFVKIFQFKHDFKKMKIFQFAVFPRAHSQNWQIE